MLACADVSDPAENDGTLSDETSGGAWAAPSLHARGLESVRKALHDQLYVVFRIYCALGTVAQQSMKKLCLETFFLFVHDSAQHMENRPANLTR